MENYVQITKSISLEKYGIKNVYEIIHNPSFEKLYNDELNPNLEGYEKGQLTELGAVNVMTGIFTGRSPKDKFTVVDGETENIHDEESRYQGYRNIYEWTQCDQPVTEKEKDDQHHQTE